MIDARSGFHDIKPLPEFTPIPWAPLLAGLAFLSILYLLWKTWKSRKNRPTAPQPPEPAIVRCSRTLKMLLQRKSVSPEDTRSLAAGLSSAVRSYLEERLCFPALEQTSFELRHSLPNQLSQALPTVSKESLSETTQSLVAILKTCEQITFGRLTISTYQDDFRDLLARIKNALGLIEKIENLLNKEKERVTGVIAQSKLGSAPQLGKPTKEVQAP